MLYIRPWCNINLYQLHKNTEKIVIIVLIHLLGFKKGYIKIVWEGFKYIGYIIVLYGDCKKVIRRLICFSPPTKCFYEDVLSHILHTILSKSLRQRF